MNANSFFKITYGLYAVCSSFEEKKNGYISNTVMQITSTPATIATSCCKDNYTCHFIQQSRCFSISVLGQTDKTNVIGLFGYQSGKHINKFANVSYKMGQLGTPILLENTLSWFECKVVQEIDVGTHIIFVGEVINCDIEPLQDIPITYTYYREIKKGKSPKNAPTFLEHAPETTSNKETWICSVCQYEYDTTVGDSQQNIAAGTRFEDLPENWLCPRCKVSKNLFNKKETKMEKNQIWVCDVCGYEYDPTVGDPDNGIAPGTAFEDIPEDWTCPLCGVGKDDFSKK